MSEMIQKWTSNTFVDFPLPWFRITAKRTTHNSQLWRIYRINEKKKISPNEKWQNQISNRMIHTIIGRMGGDHAWLDEWTMNTDAETNQPIPIA